LYSSCPKFSPGNGAEGSQEGDKPSFGSNDEPDAKKIKLADPAYDYLLVLIF